MKQDLIEDVKTLKQRVFLIEKLVINMIGIEEINLKKLSAGEKRSLKRTLGYIREGKSDKFMDLEDLRKNLNL